MTTLPFLFPQHQADPSRGGGWDGVGENHLEKEGGQTVLEKISQAANRKFLLSPDA